MALLSVVAFQHIIGMISVPYGIVTYVTYVISVLYVLIPNATLLIKSESIEHR